MQVTLEFNTNPPVNTYNHHAFGTGIITTVPGGMNWLYNNYIQLVYYPEYGKFSFDFYMDYIYCQPVFDREHIHDETVKALGIDVMDYITEGILSGKYVIMCVNEYYIPDREAYRTYSFRHNLLIYGYDDRRKVYKTAGYNAAGHFDVQEIDRKTIKKASPDNITLLKFRDNYDFSLKPEWIRYQMDAYYGKKEQPPAGAYTADGRYVGEEAVRLMCLDMFEGLDNLEMVDVRPFTLLAEHGRLMYDRIQVIKEYDCTSTEEEEYWRDERDRRELLLKRIYMYNVRLDERSAEKVRNYIKS